MSSGWKKISRDFVTSPRRRRKKRNKVVIRKGSNLVTKREICLKRAQEEGEESTAPARKQVTKKGGEGGFSFTDT